MPIDASSPYSPALQNASNNKLLSNPAYSRSSVLLMKNGEKREAYIMTIIGDSSYVQNDLTKLDRNKYNKRDTNFSGMVFYFTPKGQYINGWKYKNGKLVNWKKPKPTAQTQTNNKLKTNTNTTIECYDYFLVSYTNGRVDSRTYLFTECEFTGDGGVEGTTTGGGSSSNNQPPCPQGVSKIAVNGNAPPSDDPPIGTDNNDPGFPPPNPPQTQGSPCKVIKDNGNIKTDTLKQNFPCAKVLILDGLKAISSYYDFTKPFETEIKPDLIWSNSVQEWNPNGGGLTSLGLTQRDPDSRLGLGSLIRLNTRMLENSSQLLIASVAIHETIHGYLNYHAVNGSNPNQQFPTYGNWMLDLHAYYDRNALPANYADHGAMMRDYFSKAVGILATFDHNNHSQKEYAMTMLFGMENAGSNATWQQRLDLANLVSSLKLIYGINGDDFDTFIRGQLNASSLDKLPGGCIEP